jgi:ABC-type protease/lipase transport system fused ATPase/permease subunit
VNAHSFIKRLPDGYQTQISADGANLSQGQRQLLAIARAAVADPPVMILDEATSSIDTRTERLIEKGMDALMKDRTVFVIAHRLSTVRNSMLLRSTARIERRSRSAGAERALLPVVYRADQDGLSRSAYPVLEKECYNRDTRHRK